MTRRWSTWRGQRIQRLTKKEMLVTLSFVNAMYFRCCGIFMRSPVQAGMANPKKRLLSWLKRFARRSQITSLNGRRLNLREIEEASFDEWYSCHDASSSHMRLE